MQIVNKIEELHHLKSLKKQLKAQKRSKNPQKTSGKDGPSHRKPLKNHYDNLCYHKPSPNHIYDCDTKPKNCSDDTRSCRSYGKTLFLNGGICQHSDELPLNTNTSKLNADRPFYHPLPLSTPFLFPPCNCNNPRNHEIGKNKKALKIVKGRINDLKSELGNETKNGRIFGGCVNGEMFSCGVGNGEKTGRLGIDDLNNRGKNVGEINDGEIENALYDTVSRAFLKRKTELEGRIGGLDEEILQPFGDDSELFNIQFKQKKDDTDWRSSNDMKSNNDTRSSYDMKLNYDMRSNDGIRSNKDIEARKKIYKKTEKINPNLTYNFAKNNDFKSLNESVNNSQKESVSFSKYPQIFNPETKLYHLNPKQALAVYNLEDDSSRATDRSSSMFSSTRNPVESLPSRRFYPFSKTSIGAKRKRKSKKTNYSSDSGDHDDGNDNDGKSSKEKKSKKCQFCICFPRKKKKKNIKSDIKKLLKLFRSCKCCCASNNLCCYYPNFCNNCCPPNFCNNCCPPNFCNQNCCCPPNFCNQSYCCPFNFCNNCCGPPNFRNQSCSLPNFCNNCYGSSNFCNQSCVPSKCFNNCCDCCDKNPGCCNPCCEGCYCKEYCCGEGCCGKECCERFCCGSGCCGKPSMNKEKKNSGKLVKEQKLKLLNRLLKELPGPSCLGEKSSKKESQLFEMNSKNNLYR